MFSINSKHSRASHEAFYLISKVKTPFTICEEFALLPAIRINKIINGQKRGDELRKIQMSGTTVSKRMFEISKDQYEQLLDKIKIIQNI